MAGELKWLWNNIILQMIIRELACYDYQLDGLGSELKKGALSCTKR
jgi:hypothetical protein